MEITPLRAKRTVVDSSSESFLDRTFSSTLSLVLLQELAARQEKIRRETIELEAQLRQKTELERVKMETEGRILAERKNHDLRLEQVCTYCTARQVHELCNDSRPKKCHTRIVYGESTQAALTREAFLSSRDDDQWKHEIIKRVSCMHVYMRPFIRLPPPFKGQ